MIVVSELTINMDILLFMMKVKYSKIRNGNKNLILFHVLTKRHIFFTVQCPSMKWTIFTSTNSYLLARFILLIWLIHNSYHCKQTKIPNTTELQIRCFFLGYSEIIILVNKTYVVWPSIRTVWATAYVFMPILCEKLSLNFHYGVLRILNRRTELYIVKTSTCFSVILILQMAKVVSLFTHFCRFVLNSKFV